MATIRRRRLLAAGGGLVGSAAFWAACGGGQPTSSGSARGAVNTETKVVAAEGTAKPGGVLNLAIAEDAPNLDAHRSAAGQTATVVGPIYSRMLTFKTGGGVQPFANELIGDAVEKWQQPDATTYVFDVRPNVKWHNIAPVNGRALTAEDIVYSINRVRTPEPEYTYAFLFDLIDKIETPNAQTVRITMKEPFAPFLDNLANQNAMMVPKEAVEQFGDLKQKAIGSGPYVLDEVTKGTRYVYTKHPGYFRPGQPYIDKINLLVLPDEAYRASALRSGQLDVLGMDKPQSEELLRSTKSLVLQKVAGTGGGATVSAGPRLAINNTRPPYNDPRVREAIDRAIDRKALIATLLEGDGTIIGPISGNLPAWKLPDAEVEAAYATDLAKAKELLTAAGFPNGFKTTWEVSGIRTPVNLKAMEIIKEQLRRVNVDVTINNIEYALWQKHANTFDFIAFITGLRNFSDPDNYLYRLYHPKSPQRYCEPDNAELVALIEKQRVTVNVEQRKQLVLQAQRLILKDHYVSGLYDTSTYFLNQPYVKGWSPTAATGNIELMHAWIDKG